MAFEEEPECMIRARSASTPAKVSEKSREGLAELHLLPFDKKES